MSLLGDIRHRVAPLHREMAWRDYVSVRKAPPLVEGTTRVLGQLVRYSDNNGLLHSVKEIFRDEVYRFNAQNDHPHIIDAGANIGLSIRYFKQLYPRATIVAYEPDPDIFRMLHANVGDIAGVDLREAAAWTEDSVLTFYSEGSLAGSTEVDFTSLGHSIEVKARDLKVELRKRPVDFLKIDIEGAESDLLIDIADDLDGVDHLFFEYHSSPGKPQRLGELLSLVSRKGFRYSINGTHGPRLPFVEKPRFAFDLQMNVFCFRR